MSDYFDQGAGEAVTGGRFARFDQADHLMMAEGLSFWPLLGENVLIARVVLEPGALAPGHFHEEEQITIVLEGEMHFTVDDETRILRPGDVAMIPSYVRHEAWTTDTRCVEIDVFSPPRAGLVRMMQQAGAPLQPD